MALIECPECGKEVSDSAVSCPNCGFGIAALKEKNIVQIKISLNPKEVSNIPIVVFDCKNRSKVYAELITGEVAKFELDADTEIGFLFIGPYKRGKAPEAVKVVVPGKKYQVFWGNRTSFLGIPIMEKCIEVENFSDTITPTPDDPNRIYYGISW